MTDTFQEGAMVGPIPPEEVERITGSPPAYLGAPPRAYYVARLPGGRWSIVPERFVRDSEMGQHLRSCGHDDVEIAEFFAGLRAIEPWGLQS